MSVSLRRTWLLLSSHVSCLSTEYVAATTVRRRASPAGSCLLAIDGLKLLSLLDHYQTPNLSGWLVPVGGRHASCQ